MTSLLCNELESLPSGTVVTAFMDLFKQLSGGNEEMKDIMACLLPRSRLVPATFE